MYILTPAAATVALILAAPASAATPTAEEMRAAQQWTRTVLLRDKAGQPFSFVYDGKPSSALLGSWRLNRSTRTLGAQAREHTLTWTDRATGLEVRCVVVEYADAPAVEWTLWLKNTGQENTAMLENIQGLDARFERGPDGEFLLHGLRGDSCLAESYRPFARTLGWTGGCLRFAA